MYSSGSVSILTQLNKLNKPFVCKGEKVVLEVKNMYKSLCFTVII